MLLLGIDTGGTFTDFIFKEGDQWKIHKVLSTPDDPSRAVLQGIADITKETNIQVVHGSTVATNAILERKGVKTALLTTQGFEDILEIGRQNRTSLYDLSFRKSPPIVPENLRFGVPARMDRFGLEVLAFDTEKAQQAASAIREAGATSVGVSFLFSFANPEHELKMAEILAENGLAHSLSHQILGEFREFERTSTTVINAYVSPIMTKYLTSLTGNISGSLRIMQSNGGSISAETAMRESVRTIVSGPAGGVVGALEIGRRAGFDKLITFDMGGTSTDVSLINGKLPLTLESSISDFPVKVPMIDIHTVGAGGGSLARLDVGGSLKVGPESAGADPGPVCYGRGDQLTVTDANLYLGRLVPDYFLGGNMRLQTDQVHSLMRELAGTAGVSPVEAAEGILAVANTAMERAIRVISVERGFDPSEFVLFSFGGAGGMHCAFLASLLGIPRVCIPKNPGILSAQGMLMADVIKDYSQTVMLNADQTGYDFLTSCFAPLEDQGRRDLRNEGYDAPDMELEHFLDMRYRGQSYEIIVPFGPDYQNTFHGLHKQQYGHAHEDHPMEVVNLRIRARGRPEKPALMEADLEGTAPPPESWLGKRSVTFSSKPVETDIYSREKLFPGNRIPGPAVLVEYSSTIVLPPFAEGVLDACGNCILEITQSSPKNRRNKLY